MNPRNDMDLAQRLILRAARKAPPELSERLEEEWLADLQSRSGLARLRLALGCCWATAVITRDVRVPQLAASGASAAPRPPLGDLRYDLPRLSRRTVTLLVIAALHGLVIYAFTSGLGQKVVAAIPSVTHVVFVEQRLAPAPTPVPTKFKFSSNNLDVPVIVGPDIVLPRDADTGTTVIVGPPPPPVLPPPTPIKRVEGGPGKGFPATADYYPAASARIAETGAANVKVCVDTQGRLNGDPSVAKSSGSRRLDDAALILARAGSGHYRPSTENGIPVNSCYDYRIRFELNN